MINSDPKLTPADAARLKALYGLDQPIIERYCNWLTAALGGDLGYSRSTKPVLDILIPHLGNTVLLLGISLILSLAIAIPLGVYAALKPYSRVDYAVNLFCFAGISVPPFWFALLLILIFAVTLRMAAAGGMQTIGEDSIVDRLRYLILPILTLTISSGGRVHPLYARQHARDAAPGLRQNGTRKRVERSPRGYGSRTPKCINTARDRRRPQFRRTVFRRIDYRDNVWLARHGENHLRCNYGRF